MISPMTTTVRPQQRYDHRLRDLVRRTGDVTIATGLDVPCSTVRGWLRRAPEVVVSLDVTQQSELELQHEILQRRRAADGRRRSTGYCWRTGTAGTCCSRTSGAG